MPEEKDPVAEPAKTGEEDVKPKTMTLEEVAAQNKELSEKLDKVIKQNSDKDSFISKLEKENKEVRDNLQKLSTALAGKTEKQKDALIEAQRQKFLDKGYDAESVDLILDTIDVVADKKADNKIAAVIMDATEGLVESDPDIDKDFMEKNSEDIKAEFDSYKPEVSPRKIKANLKKAYNMVKERLADKAKAADKGKDEDREAMLAGAKPGEKGKKTPETDTTLEDIEKAGAVNSHFI